MELVKRSCIYVYILFDFGYLITGLEREIHFQFHNIAIDIVTTNINPFSNPKYMHEISRRKRTSLQNLGLISTPNLEWISVPVGAVTIIATVI